MVKHILRTTARCPLLGIGDDVEDGRQPTDEDLVVLLHALHHIVLVQERVAHLRLHEGHQWGDHQAGLATSSAIGASTQQSSIWNENAHSEE